VLGAAGLAIGLALQGSLANFAAGLLMILFRPFQVGHYIEGAGAAGTVKEIHIFTTSLTTPDNKLVVIPNAKLMGDNIVNYSANETRRVDMTVGVSYHDDLKKVRQVLGDLIDQEERILPDPEPTIAVSALADHSVNFVIRAWVNTPDYWGVYYDLTERVKTRFDEEGISIPFPQREIRVVEKISA
jgi:small conductance mechanosensitive channel